MRGDVNVASSNLSVVRGAVHEEPGTHYLVRGSSGCPARVVGLTYTRVHALSRCAAVRQTSTSTVRLGGRSEWADVPAIVSYGPGRQRWCGTVGEETIGIRRKNLSV
jgi:hypothetical protein